MCGIVGFVGRGDASVLHSMNLALEHRGPDDSNVFINRESSVFFGHTRLAVIDIDGGRQPMSNHGNDIHVIFNGEIYNHRDLRQELIDLGYSFRTDHSDTEVLVHGYDAWREDLPARLNGMFAFAIFDQKRNRVFLARDRFGEKPLFFASHDDVFVFSSELGALSRHPAIGADFSKLALQKYFAYGYFPTPHTPYENVFRLQPGSSMVVDTRDLGCRQTQYWRFSIEPSEELSLRSETRLSEELRAMLRQSVLRRLESDVPLGVFLSGGIDSTMIATFAAESLAPGELNSFSIGFEEPSFDESQYISLASRHIGTRHHSRMCDASTALACMPELMRKLDEPIADPAVLPTYMVSQLAREKVTVSLCGDGSDELFAGYDQFPILSWAQLYKKATPPFLHGLFERSSLRA